MRTALREDTRNKKRFETLRIPIFPVFGKHWKIWKWKNCAKKMWKFGQKVLRQERPLEKTQEI